MMSKCKHKKTVESVDRCYSGCVAVYPYTDENQAAHGGVTYISTCTTCEQSRAVNTNGSHVEYSPWRREL